MDRRCRRARRLLLNHNCNSGVGGNPWNMSLSVGRMDPLTRAVTPVGTLSALSCAPITFAKVRSSTFNKAVVACGAAIAVFDTDPATTIPPPLPLPIGFTTQTRVLVE